jgi:hypothetical protein
MLLGKQVHHLHACLRCHLTCMRAVVCAVVSAADAIAQVTGGTADTTLKTC